MEKNNSNRKKQKSLLHTIPFTKPNEKLLFNDIRIVKAKCRKCRTEIVKYIQYRDGNRDIVFEKALTEISCSACKGYTLSPHVDPYYTLYFPLSRGLMIVNDRKSIKLNRGQYLIENSGEMQGVILGNYKHNAESISLGFSKHFFQEVLDENDINFDVNKLEFDSYSANEKSEIIDQGIKMLIYALKDAEKDVNSLLIDLTSSQFALLLLKNYKNNLMNNRKFAPDKVSYNPKIKKAVDYLRDNYDKKFSLNDLSKATAISKPHFIKLFKEETGYSAIEYLHKYRIKKTIELLKKPNLSLNKISFEVGYRDARYLRRIFEKYTGVSLSKAKKHHVDPKKHHIDPKNHYLDPNYDENL